MNIQLCTENLGKRYHTEWIFRNLSYTFKSGSLYAITGPNGSGKSTLLKLISGQLPPSEGKVTYYVNNRPVPAEHVYSYLCMAAPYLELMDELTLLEQLQFHFSLKQLIKGYTLKQVIEDMYLTEATHKHLGNFSSGMKQRVKLGLCFFTDCPVVLLDEPSSNLDSKAMNWYREKLLQQKNDRLFIIAGNNPQEYPPATPVIDITEWKTAGQRVT